MTSFIENTIKRASKLNKTICLAEGDDERVRQAARIIEKNHVANVVLLGKDEPEEIKDLKPALAYSLYQLRKKRGMTEEEAIKTIDDPLYLAMMLLKTGRVDGVVAGAAHATSDVLRPALQIIKTAPGARLVSAFFIMCVPDCEYGENGTFIFSDSGLNVNPDQEELANIAVQSAQSFKIFIGDHPRVAMLSHSSLGSAKNLDAQKVVTATMLAKEQAPELDIDGEMQLDTALVGDIAASKFRDSEVAGKANVLIFPDLDAGNIGYKLVQRLAKADAYGPITQGLAAPVNDLSRGCSVDDIVGVTAITAIQSTLRD